MESKKPWKSATVWVNLVLALSAFYPPVEQLIKDNPAVVTSVVSLVNIALRWFKTKDEIKLLG